MRAGELAQQLSSIIELALEAWVWWVSFPRCPTAGELTLPPAYGITGWPSRSSVGELTLVVEVKGSW